MCKNRINKDNRCVCRAHQFREGRSANSRSATFERTAKAILREKLSSVPEISGWTLGDCAILNEKGRTSVYRVYDKEGREHWLYYGPWNKWQLVSDLWTHLDGINRIMVNVSPLFRAFGPMLPEVKWLKSSDGFFGVVERRSDMPLLKYLSDQNNPFRFETIVQMTGFLRFLQTGNNVFSNSGSHKIIDELEDRTIRLIDEVEERIPQRQRFSRLNSFTIQNAKALAYTGSLSLSLGTYAASCFAYTKRAALLIDYPFLLGEDMTHMDLCRILFEMRTRDHQDLKCLIDVYFDREVPSYFFAQLAYYQVSVILEHLALSTPDSPYERRVLEEFDRLSLEYDNFRTPVPYWYK